MDVAEPRNLDDGHGTVWAADARDGFNGGGESTRWVVTADERRDALDFYARSATGSGSCPSSRECRAASTAS